MTEINNRVVQMEKIQQTSLNLFSKKNKDYGDSFANYGTIGILVRMQDKINRIVSITKNGINFVNDESLRDTLIDLMNYSAMGIMCIDEGNSKLFDDKDINESFCDSKMIDGGLSVSCNCLDVSYNCLDVSYNQLNV